MTASVDAVTAAAETPTTGGEHYTKMMKRYRKQQSSGCIDIDRNVN